MSTSAADFNAQVIDEFRANAGVVEGPLTGATLLLLHHTGARSGRRLINPLVYLRDGERYVVFASAAGAPTHPAWYHNLKAHPETTIEVGTDSFTVLATEASGEERDRLFAAQVEKMPGFADYVKKAGGRVIPVIVLRAADPE